MAIPFHSLIIWQSDAAGLVEEETEIFFWKSNEDTAKNFQKLFQNFGIKPKACNSVGSI